jgi:hypothetical protein
MSELDAVVAERDEWTATLSRDQDVRAEAERRLAVCGEALRTVDERLQGVGYPVRPIVVPVPEPVLAHFDRLLDEAGMTAPPLLRSLWHVVGAVSVLDFSRYRHASFWQGRLGRTDRCTDGLHIDSPGDTEDECEGYADHLIGEREGWLESGLAEDGDPFDWPIAPDDLHKDDVSGGDPYGLRQGLTAWDHRVVGVTWQGSPVTAPTGAPDLLSYLRTAVLECGCFPGLLGAAEFEADRRYLTEGLPVF